MGMYHQKCRSVALDGHCSHVHKNTYNAKWKISAFLFQLIELYDMEG